MTRARIVAAACGALLLLGIMAWLAWPYAVGAALLLDLSGGESSIRALLPGRMSPVQISDVMVPTRHGEVPGRLYVAEQRTSRAIVVVPGIHAGGVDEPRLDALSRRLAGAGATILSLPIPALRAYRIVPAATDIIEDATTWLADLPDRTWTRVGLIGVSFSGGLAIVAAGRPALGDRLSAVVSLGGHGDLPRALSYLCTGQLPDGTRRRPHDYSVAVLLRAALPRLVAPPDLEPLDRALLAFLDGSSSVAADPEKAASLFDRSQGVAASLSGPAREILGWVHARDVESIGSRILPFVDGLGGHPALSPERSPVPVVPVFLIHGRDDNVIPSSETPLLAAYLARQGASDVHALLTPLVSHADLGADATWLDQWRLVSIWTAAWRALGD